MEYSGHSLWQEETKRNSRLPEQERIYRIPNWVSRESWQRRLTRKGIDSSSDANCFCTYRRVGFYRTYLYIGQMECMCYAWIILSSKTKSTLISRDLSIRATRFLSLLWLLFVTVSSWTTRMMRSTSTSSIYHGPSPSQVYRVRTWRISGPRTYRTPLWSIYSRYEAVYCRAFLEEAMLYWFSVIPQSALCNAWVAWSSCLLCRSVMSPGEIHIPDRYAQNRSKGSMEYCATSCLSYQHGQLPDRYREYISISFPLVWRCLRTPLFCQLLPPTFCQFYPWVINQIHYCTAIRQASWDPILYFMSCLNCCFLQQSLEWRWNMRLDRRSK